MKHEFGYNDIATMMIERGGVTRTLREWSEVLGLPYPTVRMRYKRGKREFSDLFSTSGLHGIVRIAPVEGGSEVVITRQERTFLDDLFGFDMANRVRAVAESMGMVPVDVVREMVKHGVEKVERKAAEASEKKESN